MNYDDLCKNLNRSYAAIKFKMSEIGLKISAKYNKNLSYSAYEWSEEELETIAKYGGEISDSEIQKKYLNNLSAKWIGKKRKDMGIKAISKYKNNTETYEWNGNTYTFTNKSGYTRAFKNEILYLHREIVEYHTNRKLKKEEVVHHIDLNKRNNNINNLFVCKDQNEHAKIHYQIRELGYILFKSGLIDFDELKRIYIRVEIECETSESQLKTKNHRITDLPISINLDEKAKLEKRYATEWIHNYFINRDKQNILEIPKAESYKSGPVDIKELNFIKKNSEKMIPAVIGMYLNRLTNDINKVMIENDIPIKKFITEKTYFDEDIQYIITQYKLNEQKRAGPMRRNAPQEGRKLNGEEFAEKLHKERFNSFLTSTLLKHLYVMGLSFNNGKTYSSFEWTKQQLYFIRDNYNTMHTKEIVSTTLFKGITPNWITKVAKEMGVTGKPTFTNGESPMLYNGKLYYFCNGYYIRKENGKQISLHVVVAEDKYQRKLKKDECVHHLNGNSRDAYPSNLFICKNQSEHRLIHTQLEKVVIEFLEDGSVIFDKKTGKYIFKGSL